MLGKLVYNASAETLNKDLDISKQVLELGWHPGHNEPGFHSGLFKRRP